MSQAQMVSSKEENVIVKRWTYSARGKQAIVILLGIIALVNVLMAIQQIFIPYEVSYGG